MTTRRRRTFHEGRARAAWLSEFERQVVEGRPEMAGKIDWDTAVFLFNQGLDHAEAARRVIIAGRPASPRWPSGPRVLLKIEIKR